MEKSVTQCSHHTTQCSHHRASRALREAGISHGSPRKGAADKVKRSLGRSGELYRWRSERAF